MAHEIIGRAYIPGTGECWVEDQERNGFQLLRAVTSGVKHWVRKTEIQWRGVGQ